MLEGIRRLGWGWLAMLLLVACGGGGSDGDGDGDPAPATVASVVVDAGGAADLAVGQTRTLTVEARDAEGRPISGQNFQWTSSDPAVVSVTAGMVTAVGPGNATITATAGGVTSAPVAVRVLSVARGDVRIDKVATLLPAIGTAVQLHAELLDANGQPVPAGAVTWRSSAPDQVAVDANGRIVALAIGSAQITADVAGVASAPTLVTVARPNGPALLLRDEHVVQVGAPLGLAPGELPGIGTHYEVTLQDIAAPAAGTLLIGAETAPVAGRVVATRVEAGALVATLAIVPLPELFSEYRLRFDIDLSAYPAEAAPPAAAAARRAPLWSRALRKTTSRARPHAGDDALGPFKAWDCDASIKPKLLGEPPISLTLGNNLRLVLEDEPGRSRHALEGSATISGSAGFKLRPGFEASGECKAQAQIKLPVFGWVSAIVMPAVRFGIGAELSGTVEAAQADLGVKGSLGVQTTLGWECGGASPGCRGLDGFEATNRFETDSRLPGTDDLHAEIAAHLFAVAGLDASLLLGALNAEIVEARLGPRQSFDLAQEVDQITRADYASKYDLTLDGSIKPGAALQKVIAELIGDGAVGVNFRSIAEQTLSESPKGRLTLGTRRINPGSPVDFTVDLDPASSVPYFLLGDNVEGIALYRRRDTEAEFSFWKWMDRSSTYRATYRWTPELADAGSYEFAALVDTKLLTPLLELNPDTRRTLEVSCFSTGAQRVGPQAAGQCVSSWFGTVTGRIEGVQEFTATLTWVLDDVRNADPARAPTQVFYKATGSVAYDLLLWKNLGCTHDPRVFTEFDTPTLLMIDASTSPPTYSFGVQIVSGLTIECPNSDPIVLPPSRLLFFAGEGKLNDAGTIEGSNVTPQGTMTWGFAPGAAPGGAGAARAR